LEAVAARRILVAGIRGKFMQGGCAMSLIRWEPFRGIDELFERLGPTALGRWPKLFESGGALEWAPAADISETDKEYLVKAELPGVKREDVTLTVDDGIITIAGERKQEKDEKDAKQHRVERFYGSFTRSFTLPENVEEKAIRAESKDGILYVHLPKRARAEKPKVVQIKVE
jgi:HSP20 family protein